MNSLRFLLLPPAFFLFAMQSACTKKPFHSLNQYAGTWEFTTTKVVREATELDSNLVATEFEEFWEEPKTYAVHISVKNSDELCFRQDNDIRSDYTVRDDGSFVRAGPLSSGETMWDVYGEFTHADTLHLNRSQYMDYVEDRYITLGVRID